MADAAGTLAGRTVAIVSRLYLPEPAAASFRLGALADALRDAGAAVRVLTTPPPPGYDAGAAQPGIDVRRAPVLRDRDGYVRGYLQYLSFDIPAFFRILFSRGLDAIVNEPPPTTGVVVRIAAGIRRIPYIYYAADIWADAVRGTGAPRVVVALVSAMERWAMRGAKVVLCASDEFADRLRELGAGSPIVTIGNGVDTALFGPEGPRRELDAPYLLYAGTASEVHGATIFVEALRRLHADGTAPRMVFVGQGAERDEIERLAAALPEAMVRFEGRLAPDETAAWIRGAVATLASVRPDIYHRAFPTKMYASVACGTRVVYAGAGPGRGFAGQPGFGWAVDYDVDQVAGALRAALAAPADEAGRAELAAWARDNVSLRAVAQRAVPHIAQSLIP